MLSVEEQIVYLILVGFSFPLFGLGCHSKRQRQTSTQHEGNVHKSLTASLLFNDNLATKGMKFSPDPLLLASIHQPLLFDSP